MSNNKNNTKNNNLSNKAPSLLKALLLDIFVHYWFVSLLAIAFVSSAMLLAHTSHQTRKLTAQWQALNDANEEQQVTLNTLRLEITSLSESNRISNLAKTQLGMVHVNTHNEKVISL